MLTTLRVGLVRVLFAIFAILFVADHAQCHTAQSVLMPPNTSASPIFAGLSNGTINGANNISKVNVHTLLYPGATTKVLAHYLPWWGPSPRSGINVGYQSNDPAYITKLFNDLTSRGVDGVIIDWYGQTDFTNTAWQASMSELGKFPNLSFSIMIDWGSFKFNPCSGCDVNATILYNLDYLEETYFPSQQYLRYNGHPVVTEFGLTGLPGVNWAKIQAAHPEIYWIHLDNAAATSGFDITDSMGSFLFAEPPQYPVVEATASMAAQNDFYARALTEPNKIAIGAIFKGFNSSLASWDVGVPQYIPQTCGTTWLDTFRSLNKYYSTANQLPFLQLDTWDDYEEGTELETGIDNCATLTVSENKKNHDFVVNLSHADTVDHLELYVQSKKGVFELMNTFPATMVNIPMNGSSGTFYLKAVGKPFIKNVLSQAIVVSGKS